MCLRDFNTKLNVFKQVNHETKEAIYIYPNSHQIRENDLVKVRINEEIKKSFTNCKIHRDNHCCA